MNHPARIDAALAGLPEDVPALLVGTGPNLRYLTGFTGTNGHLVLGADRRVFLTDGRYREVAAPLCDRVGAELRWYATGHGTFREELEHATRGLGRIGLEAARVTWAFARQVDEWLPAEVVPLESPVQALRTCKDADEVAAIERAQAATDAALADVLAACLLAQTEEALGRTLVTRMQDRGASGASFEPIVASGPNGSMPHHRAGPDPIQDGFLVLDFGCVVDGYCSDMTRTVFVAGSGRGPSAQQQDMYAAVREAQAAGCAAVGPGVPTGEVDRACREVLTVAGLGEFFVHGTGHGVGLEIHEEPWLRAGGSDTLAAGHVVTVEPGAYVPGVGGVRIEDMLLVTADGARNLTGSSKELLVL